MDRMRAFSILKINPHTSKEIISKRHDYFVKLYKQHLMWMKFKISPEEIEEMKEAYEFLLYKKVDDAELEKLYPQDTIWSKTLDNIGKVLNPFLHRHRAKIIYTLVMSVITGLLIYILNYKPVDLNVIIFSPYTRSLIEYQFRNQVLRDFEKQTEKNLSLIQRPDMEFGYYEENDYIAAEWLLFLWDNADVYIMEESLLEEFKKAGVKFASIEPERLSDYQQAANPFNKDNRPVTEVYIDTSSFLYRYICNWENTNKTWVAVIADDAENVEEALSFVKFINKSN